MGGIRATWIVCSCSFSASAAPPRRRKMARAAAICCWRWRRGFWAGAQIFAARFFTSFPFERLPCVRFADARLHSGV